MRSAFALIAALALFWLAPSLSLAAASSSPSITSRAQFDSLSRVAPGGRYFSVPQLQFVIDRTDKSQPGGRLYFVNSKLYDYHIDFVQQTYLTPQTVEQLIAADYSRPDRRFTFGSIVFYPGLDRYGVEFFEGDIIDQPILSEAMTKLQANFFAPLAFKPNSLQHYALAASMPGLQIIDGAAAYGSRPSVILNPGQAVGRLRLIETASDDLDLRPGDIVILDTLPVRLSPVAGILTTSFSTPLSHVNLLAKSWSIPNAYQRDARTAYAALDGKTVFLDTRRDKIVLRAATSAEIKAAASRASRSARVLKADLNFKGLPSLDQQRASDAARTGAKSANLGEVSYHQARAVNAGFSVPPGFTVPFSAYAAFVKANQLDARIDALLANPKVRTDRKVRQAALADLRAAFSAGVMDPALMAAVKARRAEIIGPGGVFARSSTNAEDLAGFNGAGLYTSVPNVLTDEQLSAAIRTVWGSVWNDTAFDAREAAHIDHRGVAAAVLIQLGMNSETSGVMITENPFDVSEWGAVFINAKRGLGLRVVEGTSVAEQIVFHSNTDDSIQLLTRSDDTLMATFDQAGGVREVPIEQGRFVLTDALSGRLAKTALAIQAWFGGKPQDIEWLTIGDKVYVVQSRPYLRGY
ncbi:MAG: pyruvate, phosphate dikinase [Caulobacteraceae bacterium]|nr:pyruvate, phosphate dikinase [Caulobacteraceae bacterium]